MLYRRGGYAAIQESLEEAVCIKITALMANVALIAPLLGPLVGAAWVHILPWEMMFLRLAVLAAISFFGLQRAMPETATRLGEKLSAKSWVTSSAGAEEPALRRRRAGHRLCQPAAAGVDCPVAGDYYQRRTGHQP